MSFVRSTKEFSSLVYKEISLRTPDAIVHLEYDPKTLTPKLGPVPPLSSDSSSSNSDTRWTRFVCISDTHTRTGFNIPDGDVLLHSGDLTNTGTEAQFEKTVEWLCSLPHRKKIIIAGNHDLTLHRGWYDENYERWHEPDEKQRIEKILEMLKGPKAVSANLIYLKDEEYKFKVHDDGKEWSVYGSPWTPAFYNWAFNYEREDDESLVSKFPKTDILLTHGPPYQIFDRTRTREDVGSEALRRHLPALRPRLHVFGHIHEAHGAYIHDWPLKHGGECPTVQNSDPPKDSTEETLDNDVGEGRERTVFVNASNWPMGHLSERNGSRMSLFGGPGFQAVVVDLRD